MNGAELFDDVKSFIPAVYTFGANDGPYEGKTAEVQITAEGSVFVSDWSFLEWVCGRIKPNDTIFPMLLLLFHARGNIPEVTRDEAREIARRNWELAPPPGTPLHNGVL